MTSSRNRPALLAWLLVAAASTGAVCAASDHEAECREAAGDHSALYDLCLLALDGRIDMARAQLEENPELTTATSAAGLGLMHIAVLSGDKGLVELALEKGAPVDPVSAIQVTPLHLCAVEGQSEIAELLLDAGAAVDPRDDDGSTPLVWAVARGHEKLVETLLKAGAEPNARDSFGWRPLHWAAWMGHLGIAKKLIDGGASVTVRSIRTAKWPIHQGELTSVTLPSFSPTPCPPQDGEYIDGTPRCLARQRGHGDCEEALAGYVYPKVPGDPGYTDEAWLFDAAKNGDVDIVKELTTNRELVNVTGSAGWTPLMFALRYGQPEVARVLIDRGADLNATDGDQWNPLMFALRFGEHEIATRLIKAGTSLETRDEDGWTALTYAARYGTREIAALLIAKGADVNVVSQGRWSPLMSALRYGDAETARLLIEKGADIDTPNDDGWCPLTLAIRNGKPDVADTLIEKGADVDRATKDGWTALMLALRYAAPQTARLLIEKGADLDTANENGWTALMFAARYGQPEAAALLIEKGADVDSVSTAGWSALMLALSAHDVKTATLLIESGCTTTTTTADGQSAMSLARKGHQEDILRLLEASPQAIPELPGLLRGQIPIYPDSNVASADPCDLAPQVMCNVTATVDAARKEVFRFYRAELPALGWTYDTSLSADDESGSLAKPQLWGLLNFTKNTEERVTSTTVLILSKAASAGGPTKVEILYQSHLRSWNPMEALTGTGPTRPRSYDEVIATYPADAERCTTWVRVTGIDSSGQWTTAGLVQYRNHQPQVRCHGVRVQLEVPATLDGLTYPAGTALTVDADLNWVAVTDLGAE